MINQCNVCGAILDPRTAVDGVVKCVCGNFLTVPKESSRAMPYLQMGEHELDTADFDGAYDAFSRAAQEDPNESEAYFGMARAKFRVQFLQDYERKCTQPICHANSDNNFSTQKFVEDTNYLRAIALATEKQREIYQDIGIKIDHIREEFLRLKNSGLDYDCFICVKVKDDRGLTTHDCRIADDIHRTLEKRGFVPFFSEQNIKKDNLAGTDYEAHILYALYSSECMLVVCFDEKYLQTPWVKNECIRFQSMINNGNANKDSDSITIVFNGSPIENLPGRQGRIQGINFASMDAAEQIIDFVDRHSPKGKERRRLKLQQEEEARKAEEEKRKQARAQMESQVGAAYATQQDLDSAVNETMLGRANQYLANRDFLNAEIYYKCVLEKSPRKTEALWGLFLVEMRVAHEREINTNDRNNLLKIITSSNYGAAINTLQDTPIGKRIENFRTKISVFDLWWNAFLNEFQLSDENDFFENFDAETSQKMQESIYLEVALRTASDGEKERVDDFLSQVQEHREYTALALQYWDEFLHDYKLTESGQLATLNKSRVRKNKNCVEAIKWIRLASNKTVEQIFEDFLEMQENYRAQKIKQFVNRIKYLLKSIGAQCVRFIKWIIPFLPFALGIGAFFVCASQIDKVVDIISSKSRIDDTTIVFFNAIKYAYWIVQLPMYIRAIKRFKYWRHTRRHIIFSVIWCVVSIVLMIAYASFYGYVFNLV